MSELTFQRYDSAGARAIRNTVALIHQEAYSDAIAKDDPFESGEVPMKRFDAYTARGGFGLVVASLGGQPVGQAWGWALGADTGWWAGLTTEVEPGFTDEDGRRTFAFSEFMVRKSWAGQGIGHALHNKLLRGRPEQRATLLVRPENTTAYRAYTRWGWQKAAQLRPNVPHAPLMDVLILTLAAST